MQSEKVTSLAKNLAENLERLSGYARAFGANVKPFLSTDQLLSVDEITLSKTLTLIENNLQALSAIDIEKQKKAELTDEISLFKEALRLNGLFAMDDITKYFEYGDIIEIYSLDFTQVYGNLQFMRFCSYDLFTLYTNPFFELYSRSSEYDVQIQAVMEKCFRSGKGTEVFSVEPHILREIRQKNNKLFKVHPKWISPLTDANGDIKGCVLTNHCIEYKMSAVN